MGKRKSGSAATAWYDGELQGMHRRGGERGRRQGAVMPAVNGAKEHRAVHEPVHPIEPEIGQQEVGGRAREPEGDAMLGRPR